MFQFHKNPGILRYFLGVRMSGWEFWLASDSQTKLNHRRTKFTTNIQIKFSVLPSYQNFRSNSNIYFVPLLKLKDKIKKVSDVWTNFSKKWGPIVYVRGEKRLPFSAAHPYTFPLSTPWHKTEDLSIYLFIHHI